MLLFHTAINLPVQNRMLFIAYLPNMTPFRNPCQNTKIYTKTHIQSMSTAIFMEPSTKHIKWNRIETNLFCCQKKKHWNGVYVCQWSRLSVLKTFIDAKQTNKAYTGFMELENRFLEIELFIYGGVCFLQNIRYCRCVYFWEFAWCKHKQVKLLLNLLSDINTLPKANPANKSIYTWPEMPQKDFLHYKLTNQTLNSANAVSIRNNYQFNWIRCISHSKERLMSSEEYKKKLHSILQHKVFVCCFLLHNWHLNSKTFVFILTDFHIISVCIQIDFAKQFYWQIAKMYALRAKKNAE